jgi:cytochrome b6-f complex iron-sulfur subunit
VQAAVVVVAVVLALVAVAVLVFGSRTRARLSEDGEGTFDRRRFLNRAMIGALSVFAVALGGGSIAVLWPNTRRGFGSRVNAGKRADIFYEIKSQGRYYNFVGRFYLMPYDTSDPNNVYVMASVAKDGLIAIYQKCSHLGCRVPYCPTSGWFECPCHDARFNGAGELMNGPAPASLLHFPIDFDREGNVIVDTSLKIAQQPRGFVTAGDTPKGELCVRD